MRASTFQRIDIPLSRDLQTDYDKIIQLTEHLDEITAAVTGNASTATKLATARAITLTGDVTGTVNFDGSAGVSMTTVVGDDSHLHSFANLTNKPTTLSGYGVTDAINVSQKGVANGVATLDASGLVPVGQLPSYVDDVLEYTNLGAFPAVGEPGKIYVALDTNKTYRWSGTVYIYITSGAVDSVAGKTGVVSLVKADIGLGNVDNTTDLLKPLSTATTNALALKANDSTVVHKTGDETIAGVKTLSDGLNIGLVSVKPVTGSIIINPTSSIPNGYLECNGATLSRTTYALLFAAIGTLYGAGDGSTTFNIPDLRGEFIRGFDNGRGIDSDRTIGSWQVDLFKSHFHYWGLNNHNIIEVGVGAPGFGTTGWATSATGGTETRPRNIAMMYCIKY